MNIEDFIQKAKVSSGHFIEDNLFKIGKYKGKSVEDVYEKDPSYIEWVYDTTTDEYDLEVLESVINF